MARSEEPLTTAMHDHWLWYLKGLGGIVAQIQEFSASCRSVRPSRDHLTTLESLTGVLQRVVTEERNKAGKHTP